MTIAAKLRELRKDIGLTQYQFLDALHKKTGRKITISTYRNYESDKKQRVPKSDILLAIANFYEIDARYLAEDNYNGVTSYTNVCKREYQKGYYNAIHDLMDWLVNISTKEAK